MKSYEVHGGITSGKDLICTCVPKISEFRLFLKVPPIPPATKLAIWSDPDLAIAKAKASQDHGMHGCNLIDRILILILAKANSIWIDQKSTG